ncbi:antibiotic biosynthesis monooxygenase family protein [Mastigocladopsis repens]|uniref:antibiotic biosynthesis monooxygenase family protein n=1 Tax=Mastigocladopsis repens TaxID=221287 RepID=UPI0003716279|nr:antibiotic biosynthesis monooxygenase family protein [Mastigocladopsis repens]
MITISEHTGIVAVNVFRVEPEQQQHVIDFLVENRHTPMKHPGCLSVNIHKGLDGTRVINYAQWRSWEEFETASKDPEFIAARKQAAELGLFDSHFYEVVFTSEAQSLDLLRE